MKVSGNKARVLDFIESFITGNNRTPSVAEIADHFGLSKTYTHRLVTSLTMSGHIAWDAWSGMALMVDKDGVRVRCVVERV